MTIPKLACEKVGITESVIWSCWRSAFNPAVAPSVMVEAGEPASPNAAEAPSSATAASGENPR